MIERDAKLQRALLWLPVKLYEMAVRLRLLAYKKGLFKIRRLDALVISVGNITVGGTGKTPMVAYIGQYLLREGYRIAVLTRGYKRESKGRRVLHDSRQHTEKNLSYLEYGDEPLMLARLLPQASIVIDKNRYDSGRWVIENHGTEILLLDDGYQHLKVHRDLNILLLDATDPFGGAAIAPLGRLREPLAELKRADVVLITRTNKSLDKASTLRIIASHCRVGTPVFFFSTAIVHFRNLTTGEIFNAAEFTGKKVAVLCGIGNPQAFVDDLCRLDLSITLENRCADHHAYSQNDVDTVIKAAQQGGVEIIITTEKDAVRLEALQHTGMPIYAAVLQMRSENEAEFQRLLIQNYSGKERK